VESLRVCDDRRCAQTFHRCKSLVLSTHCPEATESSVGERATLHCVCFWDGSDVQECERKEYRARRLANHEHSFGAFVRPQSQRREQARAQAPKRLCGAFYDPTMRFWDIDLFIMQTDGHEAKNERLLLMQPQFSAVSYVRTHKRKARTYSRTGWHAP
jgi:hypothetical protein